MFYFNWDIKCHGLRLFPVKGKEYYQSSGLQSLLHTPPNNQLIHDLATVFKWLQFISPICALYSTSITLEKHRLVDG